jgi:hypothetical protein
MQGFARRTRIAAASCTRAARAASRTLKILQ